MANTVIQLKKSSTPSQVPSSLANGELALNYADGVLYYKAANGTIAAISGSGSSPAGENFGIVNANGTLILSDTSGDSFSILPGDNITIVGDAINDRITINANLTAANSWANTKLTNGSVTLAGTLTTTDSITANGYVYINPVGGEEGGEIQLIATGSNTNWSIDSYQNNFRVFARSGTTVSNLNFFHATGGSVRLGVNKTNPDYAVDIIGDMNISGTYRVNGTPISSGTTDLTPANSYTNTSTTAANNYAGVMANSSNAYAASLTPDLSPAFNKANTAFAAANQAGVIANAAFDKANSANLLAFNTGVGANAYASSVGTSANAYATATGTAGNAYVVAVGTAGNTYASSVGTSVNAWATITFSTVTNTTAAFTVANAAFGYANGVATNTAAAFDVANAAFNQANTGGGGGGGSGVTITNETSSTDAYYPIMTNLTTGTESTANVSTSKLYFIPSTGTLSATKFSTLSDINFKNNVETVPNAVHILSQVRGVSFNWKENGDKSYGVIAQEIEKVLPEIVSKNNDMKSVNYDAIIGLLISAVNELSKEITELKSAK